ncbi:hypothetical protein OUO06_07110 [Photobacterium damselae]|uniref:hypothetical protein n=1 Tax=Photobacterium damselae TaxID=38293 RepID=UPI003C6E8218
MITKNKLALALGLVAASSYSISAMAQQDEGWINQGHSYSFSNRVEMPYTAAATESAIATIRQNDGNFVSIRVTGQDDYPKVDNDPLLKNFYKPDRLYSNQSSFIVYNSKMKKAAFWNKNYPTVTPIDINSVDSIYPGVDSVVLVSGDTITELNTNTNSIMANFAVTKPIKQIYHNGSVSSNAWVILFEDGKVQVWGDEAFGGKPNEDTLTLLDKASIQDIHVTEKSFIARTNEDKIIAWGNDEAAEVSSTAQAMIGTFPVLDIQTNKSAVAVSTPYGIFAWGSEQCGGSLSLEATLMQYANSKLDATDCSFIASNNSTGQVFVWGDVNKEATYDLGDSSFDIYAAANSYLIRNSDELPLDSINDEIPANTLDTMYRNTNAIGIFSDAFVMQENNDGISRYSVWKDGVSILSDYMPLSPAGGLSFDNYYLATDGRADTSYFVVYDAVTEKDTVVKKINN